MPVNATTSSIILPMVCRMYWRSSRQSPGVLLGWLLLLRPCCCRHEGGLRAVRAHGSGCSVTVLLQRCSCCRCCASSARSDTKCGWRDTACGMHPCCASVVAAGALWGWGGDTFEAASSATSYLFAARRVCQSRSARVALRCARVPVEYVAYQQLV